MSFLALSIALCVFAAPLLRGVTTGNGRILASGFDGANVVLGFGITALVAAFTSPLMGFGFIFSVLFYEVGAAMACRLVGHEVARVRLIPLPYLAAPRSDRDFDTALEESFVVLYAACLSIIPMLLAFSLFHATAHIAPGFADAMRAAAIMLGTFNFIMMLPFMPFAGGIVVRAVAEAFWPRLALYVTLFMTAAFASAALRDGSIAMMVLAAAGLQSILHKRRGRIERLSPNDALLVMAAYAFILCTHFYGGFSLLENVI